MDKVSIQQIAEVLTQKRGLSAQEAEVFATAIFDIVRETLPKDSQVKIKGLGTFKLVGVEARESVNIRSGERFTIDGHEKITFTPDTDMREMVNKPFSQFETVVIKENADIERQLAEIDAEETPEEALEKAPKETPKEAPEEETTAPLVETTAPLVELPVAVVPDDLSSVPEAPVAPEAPEAPEEESPEPLRRRFAWLLWALLALAVAVATYCLGYWQGQRQHAAPHPAATPAPESAAADTLTATKADTLTATKADTVTTTPTSPSAPEEFDYKKYERMDARVRTGAYRIMGTDRVVTARQGDNLSRVSRRELGDGMVCYVAVYNGMTDDQPLTEGQKIMIPKLKWKTKARK